MDIPNLEKSKGFQESSSNEKNLNYKEISEDCSEWLKEYSEKSKTKGFVIGVSGGIDSAVVSTLCAMTGLDVLILEMPIHQNQEEVTRAKKHISWLKENYKNVCSVCVDLTEAYDVLHKTFLLQQSKISKEKFEFSMSNTRSRLRMTTLYQYAGTHNYLVAGTGNKVEDFGIGFYTKYGDGGVDISPIADLLKSEVYALGKELQIIDEILVAKPTDGLHDDGRTDEDQIGATYDELEWAMKWVEDSTIIEQGVGVYYDDSDDDMLLEREKEILMIFHEFHSKNRHKMVSIPIFNTNKYR
jgi:NAD+ synthase